MTRDMVKLFVIACWLAGGALGLSHRRRQIAEHGHLPRPFRSRQSKRLLVNALVVTVAGLVALLMVVAETA